MVWTDNDGDVPVSITGPTEVLLRRCVRTEAEAAATGLPQRTVKHVARSSGKLAVLGLKPVGGVYGSRA